MFRQRVECVRAGNTQWGQIWVDQHGKTKSHEPGMWELLSFANHDLGANRLPRIENEGGMRFFVTVRDAAQAKAVLDIISYHGFEFVD
jgi:hypothetical protein